MKDFKVVIWDFDGVIKESVLVKAEVFAEIFNSEDHLLKEKIKNHHLENTGISRFKKIPLYLSWAGKSPNKEDVDKYAQKFSKLVVDRVVSSKWVPGAEEILRSNPFNQIFVLVSATPLKELNLILEKLNLGNCFKLIYGSPQNKSSAISEALNKLKIDCKETLFIGDSITDYDAANINNTRFLLRRNDLNIALSKIYRGSTCKDFSEFIK